MSNVLRALILCAGLFLASCASVNFSVLEINSLAAENPGEGSFDGLESLVHQSSRTDRQRVNIIFLHGIGWVENPEDKPLANAFISGVANAYGRSVESKAVSALCGRDEMNEQVSLQNHIYIRSPEPKRYRTSIPGRQLELDRLVCMDRQVLPVRNDLEYVIYRIFWDEVMWESLQYAHVGQDDSQGQSLDFASLRRSVNRNLKDKFVNYGFSDAVMYLGPAGQEIRDAIRGGMCAAALDANGLSFDRIGPEVDYLTVCDVAETVSMSIDPFAFVAESLGSKIALDVIRDAMTDHRETVHDLIIRDTKVFMLANQIPLLSLSDLSDRKPFEPSDYAPEERPTLVAFSEINDFLTYELVPFYEQLYANSQIDPTVTLDDIDQLDRRRLVDLLGFNVIDMRVEFANPLIPLVKAFVDPEFAHNGHVRQPEIMQLILCGGDNGVPRLDGCLVERPATR